MSHRIDLLHDHLRTALYVRVPLDEIAAAATEQSHGVGQVRQAVNQMDDVTRQTAALVDEASAASKSLKGQADALAGLVGECRVGQEAEQRETSTQPLPPLAVPLPA
ncbi:hypothetical protein [Luteibacter sp. 9135]|uniref:hypothetical protein n=1 Tax=Luteibacter sp. 9135 TaxID=1500893 RepID=UPI0005630591|nr:hypothetical protein [Luteibacter sp. 9135]